MRTIRVSDVNVEAAKRKAINELKVNSDYVNFTEIDEQTVEASVNVNIEEFISNYLANFFDECYISFEIVVNKTDKSICFNVDSSDNPLLIGREGRGLSALQTIIRHIARLYSDEYENVSVDVGDYKAKRNEQLEKLAARTAKEVSRSKISAELKGLNSYERRIVHAKLASRNDVETKSYGVEPNRYLVISPK